MHLCVGPLHQCLPAVRIWNAIPHAKTIVAMIATPPNWSRKANDLSLDRNRSERATGRATTAEKKAIKPATAQPMSARYKPSA
ncbi:MAG: hypothetical protein K9L30_18690 [Desulfobacterales bacterium]|nr:hypothetical protein [Desulfobacterales bacterium]